MKTKVFFAGMLLLAAAFLFAAFTQVRENEAYALSQRELILRSIGHQLLLQSGDKTSRVLPVIQKNAGQYELPFEKPLAFRPEDLEQITSRVMHENRETAGYLVKMKRCGSGAVVYGFSGPLADGQALACSGRPQRKDCYTLSLTFETRQSRGQAYAWCSGLLVALVFPVLLMRRKPKAAVSLAQPEPAQGIILLGTLQFDPAAKQLQTPTETLALTAKEVRLLSLLAQNPNQLIPRQDIQKQIWEDEGVIVGRSLDVFVSKLRKKLEADASVQIVNSHGKGYKLQMAQGVSNPKK